MPAKVIEAGVLVLEFGAGDIAIGARHGVNLPMMHDAVVIEFGTMATPLPLGADVHDGADTPEGICDYRRGSVEHLRRESTQAREE